MPKVSVIIPIYGVEEYIERCARSLFEQTLDDMEFVFVDDCTKDNSITILENVIKDYSNRQKQIKIIHHDVNKGLSHARETGVKSATGEYIGHCDSDDWVSAQMYESMYNKAVDNNLDFVKCGHYVSNGHDYTAVEVFGGEEISSEDAIRYLLLWRGWNSIWDTLVKRSIYLENRIEFTDFPMLEDFFVTSQVLMNTKSIEIVNEPLYYYYVNPYSISNNPEISAIVKRGVQAEKNIYYITDILNRKYGDKFKEEELILKTVPRRILVPIMRNYSNYKYWNQLKAPKLFRLMNSKMWHRSLKLQYFLINVRLYPIFKLLHRNRRNGISNF